MKQEISQKPSEKVKIKRLYSSGKFTIVRRFLLLGGVACVAGISGTALALVMAMTPLRNHAASARLPNRPNDLGSLPATLGRPVNILILGIDNSGHPHSQQFTPATAMAGNSDTMLLVRLLPDTHQINVLSIPRDTQVQLPGVGIDKINDANVRGGVPLAAQTVSQTLHGVPLDRYIRLDTEGFIHLVDALGGVAINVPRAMDYVDRTQQLNIHIAPGMQLLNGQHLQEYIRFRHDEWGDIGRVQRQQEALKAILYTLLQPATISKLPKILQVAQENVDTDLSVGEMLAIAQFLAHTRAHSTNFVMLPGRFSLPSEYPLSYWIADPQATAPILARYFDGPSTVPVNQAFSPDLQTLQVAVINATENLEVGTEAVALLRQRGFKNVYLSEHELDVSSNTLNQTQIIAQHGNPEAAEVVRQLIKTGQVEVVSTGDLSSDVTVVVGTDLAKQLTRQ
ncbi:MAG: LCP family protein [Kovacikia sp.]